MIGRTLNIGGRFANIGVGIPFVVGHVEGLVLDQFQQADRTGFGDLALRVAVNLYGAPAMTRQQFAKYRATTIVGVSFVVGAPVGQCPRPAGKSISARIAGHSGPSSGSCVQRPLDVRRRHRRGVFHRQRRVHEWGHARAGADRVAPGASHLHWRPGLWLAADGNYWKGGRITNNGISAALEQKNSRAGATLALPIKRQQWRFSYSLGAYTTIGGDYHSFGVSYTYAWTAARP